MPDPNDILKAMRSAGEDFAKMADTIEGKLPGIAKALSRAPKRIKPLIRDLTSANELTERFIKSLDKVNDIISDTAVGTKKLVRHFGLLGIEAGKTAMAVHKISDKMNKVGEGLRNRTRETAALRKGMDDLSKKGTMPNPKDKSDLGSRTVVSGVANDADKNAEAMKRATSGHQDFSKQLKQSEANVKALEAAMSQVGAVAAKSTKGFDAKQARAYGKDVSDAVSLLEDASNVGPIDFVTQAMVKRSKEAAKVLGELGEDASDGQIAEATKNAEISMRRLRASGASATKELTDGYKKVANEAKNWYGMSLKDEAEMIALAEESKLATAEMVDDGMNKILATAIGHMHFLNGMPGELGKEFKSLKNQAQSFGKELFGIKDMSLVGLAKSFMDVSDSIKEDRQQIMELTAQAGMLSNMFQSGMSAGQVKGEFEKLRTSMNNMLNTWGKSRQEVQASMKSLTEAGFSMSELTGPTLDASESMFGLARGGEYAMSGMQQVAAISTITGKSMEDVANMTGQWRDRMGVSISDIGQTYLELESAAKRSGVSVGKFMDRLMASSSGFVLMGGNMDNVANSLSNLMAGMEIPPGMSADIASSFMDRMNKMTVDDALLGISMVGDAGAKLLQDGATEWAKARKSEVHGITRDLAKLEKSDDRGAAYNKRKEELLAKRRKAEEGGAMMAELSVKAAQGDRKAQALLYQEMARRGLASAAQVKVLSDLASIGVDTKKIMEDEAHVAKGMLDAMHEKESTLEGRMLLEQQAQAAGYSSYKEWEQITKSMVNAEKMQNEFADTLATGDRERAKALLAAAKAGDIDALKKALEDADTGEMTGMFRRMQDSGVKFSSATLEAWEAAGEDAEKQRQVLAETIGQKIEVPEAKTLEEQALKVARDQLTYQKQISEYMDAIKKWGVGVIAILAAIKLAQSAGAMGKMGGLLGKLKGGKGMFGGSGRAAGGLKGAFGSIRTVISNSKIGQAFSSVSGSLRSFGGTALKMAAKWAGPLTVAAEGVFAVMELSSKKSAAYQNAYNRALEQGKSEAEAKKIAGRASNRALEKSDVGKAVGQTAGAAVGTVLGAFAGPLGMAIGGYLGAKAGALLGETIGDALETEAEKFTSKLEEVIDLGTLADAKALVAEEEKERDKLQAEKMALIDKEASGEKLTYAERKRLNELKQELTDKEREIELAKHAKWIKENQDLAKKVESGMSSVAKIRLAALRKKRELTKKKQHGKLSAKEEKELVNANATGAMSDKEIKGKMLDDEQAKLEKKKAIMIKMGGGKLSDADKAEVEKVDKRLAEIHAQKAPAGPLEIGGGAAALPLGVLPPDLGSATGQLVAAQAAKGKAAKASVTDNSQWSVHINTRSEKEIEQSLLKTLQKHQQKLAN